MKRILVDASSCSGCRACEAACAGYHERKFGPLLTRIRVVKREDLGVDTPVTCRQCGKAPCVASCPVGALSRDATIGAVKVDGGLCVGCGLCVDSCINGSMTLHPETGMAMTCDLCGGDPQCVAVCPTTALAFGALDDVARRKREKTVTSGKRG